MSKVDAMENDNSDALKIIILGDKPSGWNIRTALHPVFRLLGELDELVSLLGVVKCHLRDKAKQKFIDVVQNDLFLIQAEIGVSVSSTHQPGRIGHDHVLKLAEISGTYEQILGPLTHFIIPGGTMAAALLHYARSVVRRVERVAFSCKKACKLNEFIPPYLDRLSYLLFQMARDINRKKNVREHAPDYYRMHKIKRRERRTHK